MFAKDIMTSNVITVGPDKPLTEIARLLIECRISAVPVVNETDELLGIVSEGDLVHRVRGDFEQPRSWWLGLIGDPNDEPEEYIRSHGKLAKDVMTDKVTTVTRFTAISEIAEILEVQKIKRVPVIDDNKLVGIVSRANIIQALVSQRGDTFAKKSASDEKIRESLLEEFKRHSWSSTITLNVTVSDGVVRYWGFIESEKAKEALRLAAENTPGVTAVESHLGISASPNSYI